MVALMARIARKILYRLVVKYRTVLWKVTGMISKTLTVRTKEGLLTVFCKDDPIGKCLYIYHEFELDLIFKAVDLLREIKRFPLSGQGTILDIGANMGVISIGVLYNKFLDKAIAIEPDPQNFYLLQRNVKQNNLENSAICLPWAVSDKKAKVQLELSDSNFGDHRIRVNNLAFGCPVPNNKSSRKVIDIESDSLDNIIKAVPSRFSDDIALIWIDVQGHEGYAFRGGKTIFSKDIPVVAEIWPYGIKRSGMSQEQFCAIAENIWSSYWVIRRGKFVRYPIAVFNTFFDELSVTDAFDNVIFTK